MVPESDSADRAIPARPPAGWYVDPSNAMQLRWWDGTDWRVETKPRPPEDARHPREGAESRHGSGRSDISGVVRITLAVLMIVAILAILSTVLWAAVVGNAQGNF